MTFSEYFNGLYKPLKNEEKKADFFDQMISHFIDEDACEGCTLLHVDSETKPRYARERKPNPIKADNAKYLYARRNYNRYTTWVENLLEVMDAYEVVESWLTKSGIEFEDASDACYKLLADIFYNIGFPKSNEEAIILPQKEKDSDIAESKWTEHDNALVAEFNSDYDKVMQMCIGDRYAQEYLTGRLSKKVNTLYNSKWKDKSAEFEDILLRSDILAVLGTLQELCDALNDYLLEIKKIVYYNFNTVILHNLDKFPLNQDTALLEYYTKIAGKIMLHPTLTPTDSDKYYIQKLKPFFINGCRYYEVTFTPATDKVSKSRRVIAFTRLPITGNYASKFKLVEEHIEILGKTMPILIITGWEVSIRNCEFKNFSSIVTGVSHNISYPEQKKVCGYLTQTGYTLTELMDFSDAAYQKLTNSWRANLKSDKFIQILTKCREIIRSERPGQNVLQYLLYCMNNTIIKKQRGSFSNNALSDLYLLNGCIPFDKMPFIYSPLYHNPRLGALFEAINPKGREHELLARQIKNNTEISGRIFTPVSELEHYGDVPALANTYYYKLWFGHRERSQIIVNNGFAYINEYKLDTCNIIDKLMTLSNIYDPNYREIISFWIDVLYDDVDCEEKRQILMSMFEQSKVAVIYGSAGVGKSTIINHISHFYEDKPKLYLTHTNSAKDNLMRRVDADHDNCDFNTVASFIKYGSATEYELLVLDECSTISNADMVKVLNTAKFERILLVGDTYQINSIRFGNWFTTIRAFLPPSSVFELTRPYRTTNQHLLDIWAKVRRMDGDVQEYIEMESCSLNVDDSLFSTSKEEEVILCLNYDGLYGINNINRFLQESNPNAAFQWDIQCYKVGDPVLFLENNRFHPIIYNNMRGTITGIEILDKDTVNEHIQFDVELNTTIDPKDTVFSDIEYIGESERGNSIVRFDVYKNKNVDEDDDHSTSKTIVPFQIAYAVSIHKAQGLEYDSVKIVITDEVDELISHNIFYTAITRAKKELRIYWTAEVEKKVLQRISPSNIDDDIEVLKTIM